MTIMINSDYNNYDEYYDSLDVPPASYTNRMYDPKTIDEYVEFLKLGNQIKENKAIAWRSAKVLELTSQGNISTVLSAEAIFGMLFFIRRRTLVKTL